MTRKLVDTIYKDRARKLAIANDPAPWKVVIEPLDRFLPFGRWRIYLSKGVMRYAGNDGWGWTAYTLGGARRKAARELTRRQGRERRLQIRALALAESEADR